MIDTNLKTPFFLAQAGGAAAWSRRARGKIINIASMLSFQGGIRVPSYTASKSGVAGLTKAAGQRVGGEGHQRQRHRAGLHRDQQHRGAAGRRDPQPADPRAHPGRALGRAGGHRRGGGVPRLAGGGLRARAMSSRSTAAGWRAERRRRTCRLLRRIAVAATRAGARSCWSRRTGSSSTSAGLRPTSRWRWPRSGTPARYCRAAADNRARDRRALAALRGAGVDTAFVAARAGPDGPLFLRAGAGPRAVGRSFTTARAAPSPRPNRASSISPARWTGAALLHCPGSPRRSGPRVCALASAAIAAAVAAGVPVCFDGNYRAKLWAAWDCDPRAAAAAGRATATILFGNHRDISLLLGREFHRRRRRAAARGGRGSFRGVPQARRLIASTARHVVDAGPSPPRRAGRPRATARARPTRSTSPGSSTGSAPAMPLPRACCTACWPAPCARIGRERAWRWPRSSTAYPAT